MLVLSRKKSQAVDILLGGQVVASLMVVEIRGDKVRLGFDAGQEVEIHRREVYDAICRNEGKRAPGDIVPGIYRVTKEWHVIVANSVMTVKAGSMVEVGQMDTNAHKAIVQFGDRDIDWIHIGLIGKFCSLVSENVTEGGA